MGLSGFEPRELDKEGKELPVNLALLDTEIFDLQKCFESESRASLNEMVFGLWIFSGTSSPWGSGR